MPRINWTFFFFQIIDHLTQVTKWASDSIDATDSGVRGVRIQLSGQTVVLVDTPGFNNTYKPDIEILELIGEWLKKT